MSQPYSIKLKPVYSCPASDVPEDVNLPENWTLAWHQLETLKALRDPEIDVVINTAMTGDGKSLASYLKGLLDGDKVIGLYPTNELARDQETQIAKYIENFQPSNEPRIYRLSGATLEVYAEQEGVKKADAIATRTSQSEILLTNPDIFHYLHRHTYLAPYENPDRLWNRIDKRFKLILSDEFHVFAAPQVASIINTMLLIRCTNRRNKFLFLSATPDKQLIDRLEKAKFRLRLIDPIAEGKYEFPETEANAKQLAAQNWRQILREVSLHFIKLESAFKAAETWLKENQDLILRQFQAHPGSKGAIILNSIASVKRLVPIFRELLEPHGLKVGENTGLSGTEEKAQSLAADLVLGTSTIDVGVDFKINFLVFESSDPGNFIQRLGRLGRHQGYERNGETIEFENFTAYALVPKFLVERLFEKQPALLESGGYYNRPYLNEVIRNSYRRINNFEGYYKKWGSVQAFKLWWGLGNPNIKDQYASSREKLQADCEAVFGTSLGRVAGRIKGWSEEYKSLFGSKDNPIFKEASSFRGSSPLQCGLYDQTEPHAADRFKTYDLPGILSNLEIEPWTKAGFMRSLVETSERLGQPIAKGQFKHCLAFMKLKGYREERLNWRFIYPGNLQPVADAWKVQILTGIEVWQPDNPWIGAINRELRKQGLVCYVLPRPVAEVRQRLQLPMHFAIYPICDETSIHTATPPYAIAISQAAFLLDTLATRFKSQGGELWIA